MVCIKREKMEIELEKMKIGSPKDEIKFL